MALLIITACSGTGKSTLVRALLNRHPQLRLSVSHTTRKPREGEEDGVHYHFIEHDQFRQMIQDDAFVEWAEYAGNYYGTSHQMILDNERQGFDLVFEVEVKGAQALRTHYEYARHCFILPPSWAELEHRLTSRQTEDQATIQRRLAVGKQELKHAHTFDYVIVNDQLEQALEQLSILYQSLRLQTRQNRQVLDDILNDINESV